MAIILTTIVTMVLVVFLVISIKKDVINKPQFLGGKKSFIDLYQNNENKEEVPDQSKNMVVKSYGNKKK